MRCADDRRPLAVLIARSVVVSAAPDLPPRFVMFRLSPPLVVLCAVALLSLIAAPCLCGPFGRAKLTPRHISTRTHREQLKARCQSQQDFDLAGVWVKHDRAVVEVFHINITCTANCLGMKSCMDGALPTYEAWYMDGDLAGHNTFNVTSVGDYMSATGTYNNFADSTGDMACPAPFGESL
jgi:hypothetical protein